MQTNTMIATEVRPTPQLLLTRELLSLSSDDLCQRIEAEVASNPALDWVDEPPLARTAPVAPAHDDVPLEGIDRPSLTDHLIEQLHLQASADEFPLASALVYHLDRRGWLTDDLAALARDLGAPEDRLQHALALLQSMDPPGIGARNAQEALLLQLDGLDRVDAARCALARRLIQECFADLGRLSRSRIASALGVSVTEVDDTLTFVRANLTPYPAHAFWGDDAQSPLLVADVIIATNPSRPEGDFVVTVLEESRYRLHVPAPVSRAATGHPDVEQHVARARLFIASLKQRWCTLRRVTEALSREQRPFVLHGPRFLRPLTQTRLADSLGIHESTVSRTVRHKLAQLPDGRIVPLSVFFASEEPAKVALQDLIKAETVPLSDDLLTHELARLGFHLSRRTVAKYRAEMGIPAAHGRSFRTRA
ncbi:MAG: hypothetical protein U0641_16035 [Anaerolineae bacterium]